MIIDNNLLYDFLKIFLGVIIGVGITIVKYKYITAHENQKSIAEMKGKFNERYNS